ncbi:hypothetical protein D7X30_31160 [Corallococcus sp. AB011P]|uniref:hypothetical protein n=1 Tax=unclassified Corallococcus TaxID=2685029 RepID=UPI000EA3CFFC|nr:MULTISPECIES: hypothetical protein [unclassified Corallococcus]RKG53429.1 hypothetical protein D7X30_31160 [Corallococcus sp. AB011P]RKH89010.1 hypothetical protein D7Y21_12200 [Corallococcus sp. AB045]
MKKILFGLAAMASLTLTACGGGDYCDRTEDLAKDLASKFEECGFDSNSTPEEPTEAETKACKDGLESCNDSDKDKLDAALDCVDSLKSCSDKSQSEQAAFSLAFLSCYSKATGVSASCSAGVGISIGEE